MSSPVPGVGGILSFLPQQGAPSSPLLVVCGQQWALPPCPAPAPCLPGFVWSVTRRSERLMGTRLLWGWFRADLQPGIEQELCSMPGALQSCSYLVWKLLCSEEKWSQEPDVTAHITILGKCTIFRKSNSGKRPKQQKNLGAVRMFLKTDKKKTFSQMRFGILSFISIFYFRREKQKGTSKHFV